MLLQEEATLHLLDLQISGQHLACVFVFVYLCVCDLALACPSISAVAARTNLSRGEIQRIRSTGRTSR